MNKFSFLESLEKSLEKELQHWNALLKEDANESADTQKQETFDSLREKIKANPSEAENLKPTFIQLCLNSIVGKLKEQGLNLNLAQQTVDGFKEACAKLSPEESKKLSESLNGALEQLKSELTSKQEANTQSNDQTDATPAEQKPEQATEKPAELAPAASAAPATLSELPSNNNELSSSQSNPQ